VAASQRVLHEPIASRSLGETIVVTGATASHLALTPARTAAIVVAFIGTAIFYWLYFDEVADRAAERLAHAGAERGRLARDAFTYLHIPIVAGMLVTAVGDELVIAHPLDPLHGRPEGVGRPGWPGPQASADAARPAETSRRRQSAISGRRLAP